LLDDQEREQRTDQQREAGQQRKTSALAVGEVAEQESTDDAAAADHRENGSRLRLAHAEVDSMGCDV